MIGKLPIIRGVLLICIFLAGASLMDMTKGANLPSDFHAKSTDSGIIGQPKAGSIAHAGLLDQSFNPDGGTDLPVYPIALRADGKIIIGGKFTTVNGVGRNRIARLNSDGSLDESFSPGSGTGGGDIPYVNAIALQEDGAVLLGGYFLSVNGAPRNRIARLRANGPLDGSFDPGSGADSFVYTICLQPDGKIVIGGEFTHFRGAEQRHLARLNPDGTLDSTFNIGSGADNSAVNYIARQSNGKLIVSGNFSMINGAAQPFLARLETNGSVDKTFKSAAHANAAIAVIAIQPNDKIVIGGNFTRIGATPRNRIARLNIDGSLDLDFDPGNGMSDSPRAIVFQSDGKLLVGGFFKKVDNHDVPYLCRLFADGKLDQSFQANINQTVHGLALQQDGQILIGGEFTMVDGKPRMHIARLEGDRAVPKLVEPRYAASVFSFSFDSLKQRTYELQFKRSLSEAVWTTVTNIVGDGGTIRATDVANSSGNGFYQLVVK